MNENVWPLILLGGGLLAFLLVVSFLSKNYSLNNFKSKTVGDGQHGTARWATPREISKTYRTVPFRPRRWRKGEELPTEQGLVLGSVGGRNHKSERGFLLKTSRKLLEKLRRSVEGKRKTKKKSKALSKVKKMIEEQRDIRALVDSDDIHCLMIGASGVGKTAFFLAADALLLTPTLYPAEVNEYASGEEMRLERTYLLSPTDDPASIPIGDFEREGWHYTLLDVTRQENPKSDAKDYAETYTLNTDTKDMEAIMPQLAAERTVTTEDGYTGTLVLDTSSIKVEAAGYNTSTKTVTAVRSYPNLSDADVSFVPKSITDNGRTMELADVQWQESDGFYHASATYTGKVSSKYATGYIVTVDYSGEVVRTTMDDTIYTAIFSGTPIQPERSAIDWRYLLILPAGAGVAGLGVLGHNWLKKRKNEKKWEEYTK